jgi:hypothetical protein
MFELETKTARSKEEDGARRNFQVNNRDLREPLRGLSLFQRIDFAQQSGIVSPSGVLCRNQRGRWSRAYRSGILHGRI